MNCPKCSAAVPTGNLNVQTDVGKCDACGFVFTISEQVFPTPNFKFDILDPPKGCWYKESADYVLLGATKRSRVAFFLVPFMIIWTGGSLGGIYGPQIMSGKWELMESLFGIPFLLGAILFWGVTFLSIWGKVEARLTVEGGSIFTGIGKIGITKNFYWQDISRIYEDGNELRYPDNKMATIVMEGKKRIKFASGLSAERRYYLVEGLKKHQLRKLTSFTVSKNKFSL